jgi:hypothetical protein
MTEDELRTVVAELPIAEGLLHTPRGYVIKARPDAAAAEAAGTDLHTLDEWVVAQGGQVRTAQSRGTGGVRPGQRHAPPPPAPQRVYLIAESALSG